jgi:DHA2 family multidrug resistance protein
MNIAQLLRARWRARRMAAGAGVAVDAAGAAGAEAGAEPEISAQAWLIVLTATLSAAAYGFTWNAVTVALPHMMGSFAATPDQISWIMIAFIVGSAVATASAGWFANRFGKRRVFLVAGAGFAVSLLGCALADSLAGAVFWRFCQGITGAAMLPISQIIAVNAFPPERYTKATSYWAIGFIGANVMSPAIGGFLIEAGGWPAVFLIPIPFALLFVVLGLVTLPDDDHTPEPMDWVGFASLILGLGLLQVGLARGERLGWLDSPSVLALLGGAAAFFWIFMVHTASAVRPFIPPSLFANRNFALGVLFVLTMGGIMYLPMFFLPLLLAQVAGYPPAVMGLALAGRGVGSLVGLLFQSHWGDRIDPRWLLTFGCLILVTSTGMMSRWSVDVVFGAVFLTSAIYGASASFTWGPLNKIALSRLPKAQQNIGFSVFYLAFEIGGAIGTAVFVTVHTHLAQSAHALLTRHVHAFNEAFDYVTGQGWGGRVWDLDKTGDLAALAAEIGRQSQLMAHTNIFLLIAVIFTAMIPVILIFRRT